MKRQCIFPFIFSYLFIALQAVALASEVDRVVLNIDELEQQWLDELEVVYDQDWWGIATGVAAQSKVDNETTINQTAFAIADICGFQAVHASKGGFVIIPGSEIHTSGYYHITVKGRYACRILNVGKGIISGHFAASKLDITGGWRSTCLVEREPTFSDLVNQVLEQAIQEILLIGGGANVPEKVAELISLVLYLKTINEFTEEVTESFEIQHDRFLSAGNDEQLFLQSSVVVAVDALGIAVHAVLIDTDVTFQEVVLEGPLSDVGVPRPEVSPSGDVYFGQITVGGHNSRVFTVQNVGGGTLVGHIELEQEENAFQITGDTDFSLPDGDSQDITVTFAPQHVRAYSAKLIVTEQQSSIREEVGLLGTGTAAEIRDTSSTSITPTITRRGDSVMLQYEVYSPFSTDLDAWLGASIVEHGTNIWTSDTGHDEPIVLQSGVNTYSRQFDIPTDANLAEYDVVWGLWKGAGPSDPDTEKWFFFRRENALTISGEQGKVTFDSSPRVLTLWVDINHNGLQETGEVLEPHQQPVELDLVPGSEYGCGFYVDDPDPGIDYSIDQVRKNGELYNDDDPNNDQIGFWFIGHGGDIYVVHVREEYHVQVMSNPLVATLTVDGEDISPEQQPKEFVWEKASLHSLYAPATVINGNRTYEFNAWFLAESWLSDSPEVAITPVPGLQYVAKYLQRVDTPTFSPDGGTFISPVDVTISCATPDATIHYTTDGSIPTESDPEVAPGGTVTVDHSLTLKAKAWKPDWNPSEVKSADYIITGSVGLISPNGGETWYAGEAHEITWSAPGLTGNVEIHYSTDSGATYPNHIATVPATDGSYAWTIPDVNSTRCRVRVQEEGGGVTDESDADFTISARQVIFVDADASVGGNGRNWGMAYKYLQDALAVAVSGDEIWVAAGTYQPDQDEAGNVTPGDRTATFQLRNGVAIYGGFPSSGDPNWNDRDPNAYATILSGDIGTVGDSSDNSYHVVMGSGMDATVVLDGFTITAGNANGSSWSDPNSYGGGMYNYGGSPTLTNCTFFDNSAFWTDDGGAILPGGGGGMYNNFGSPTLTNCMFSSNSASNGGGMYNDDSSPTVTNCTFSGNSADWDGSGGGMYNIRNSNPMVTNCTFSRNCAWWGNGGGMYNHYLTSPTLINCTFNGNVAGYDGGGVYNAWISLALTNCTFSGNVAGDNGGGVYNMGSSPALTNCTLSGNSAGSVGGGMANRERSNPTLTNCVLWGNTGGGSVGEFAQIYNGTPEINYCCIQGWTGILGGTGNIGSAPLFVDADGADDLIGTEDDNLRLSIGSPCIDNGDNAAIPVEVETDLAGHPRIIDGDCNDTDVVDMGAYEFNYAYIGDFNYNCEVDFGDLGAFVELWQEAGQDLAADLNRDGLVDFADFAHFAKCWLQCNLCQLKHR